MSKLEFYRKAFGELLQQEIAAWEKLTDINTLFSSPFFQYDFAKAVAKSELIVEVVIGVINNKIVFILPIQYNSKFDLFIGVAKRLGGHLSDYSGPIIDEDYKAEIFSSEVPVPYVFLDHIPKQCHQLVASSEYVYQANSSLIRLEGEAELYFSEFKQKSKKYYNDVKRLERLVCKDLGDVTFNFQSTSEVEYHQLFDRKISQYKVGGVPNPLACGRTKRILLNLFRDKKGAVTPYLSTLYAGDTWLASHFGIESNGVFHYWFPVHNVEVNKYSPGKQLLFQIIEKSYESKLRYIDLGSGETNFKDRFCNDSIPLFKLEMVSDSIKGKFARTLQTIKWRFAD